MLAGDGLHPSSKGKRIRFSGKTRTVIDEPFAEAKELIADLWIWQVNTMEEAVEWARRCLNPMRGDSEWELRPLFEIADFDEAGTPEVLERRRDAATSASEVARRRWGDARRAPPLRAAPRRVGARPRRPRAPRRSAW